MIVVGIVLLIVGLLLALHVLFVIGVILLAVGLVLELSGSVFHRQIGGRRWY